MLPKFWTISLALTAVSTAGAASNCKCSPLDACWPSAKVWSDFNRTLSGRLIHAVPAASVCYSSQPDYNETKCTALYANWFNSSFQAADPIGIDYPIWANNSCNPIYPNGTSLTGDPNAGKKGCTIGKYPVYVVNATEASHVQAAIKFAKQYNIRLNVKNTGHSLMGRSTAFGSLSIWTHHFRGVQYHQNWQSSTCKQNGTQMAVTVGAGEVGISVLAELAKYNAVTVTGGNTDVGIAGWFTGGGHGPLTSTYGMGADNILEATIVTPEAELLTVNACNHPDLFWAIRGGGGSTFGVITQVVMKAYVSPYTTHQALELGLINGNASAFWDLMAYLHGQLPAMKAGGLQGYYTILPKEAYGIFTIQWTMLVYDKPNGTIEALTAPFLAQAAASPGTFVYSTNVTSSPSYWEIYSQFFGAEAVATGGSGLGSRLLTEKSLVEDNDLLANAFDYLMYGESHIGALLGNLIANSNNRGMDVAMNPAWRDAVTHFIIVDGWSDSLSPAAVQAEYDEITYNKTYDLRQFAPDSGAYFNEADPFEPDWQWTFFGPNYPRLQIVKAKYDPDNVMWCRSCVGSEAYVEQTDGKLCAVSWAEPAPLNSQ